VIVPISDIIIAEKIKNYRKEKNISQNEFGKMIGVSAQAVFKWEHGLCYPDITYLPHLAKLLGCSVDDFFG